VKLSYRTFIGAALGLALVAPLAAQPAPAKSDLSVETIFKRPEYGTYIVSPDGKKLASLVPINGRDNVVVIDLEKRSRTNLTNFDSYDATTITWITNNRLWFRTTEGRDVSGRTRYKGSYAINIDGTAIKNIDSFRGTPTGSELVKVVNRESGDMIMLANLRRREAGDLYLVNTLTNKLELLTFDAPANTVRFLLDDSNAPRFAWAGQDPKNTMTEELWYRADASAKWQKLQSWKEGGEHWEPVSFNPDGKSMIVRSNIGRDKFALYEMSTTDFKLGKLVFEHPLVDLDGANLIRLGDPNKPSEPSRVVGTVADGANYEVEWLDPELANMQKQIDAALPGKVNTFSPSAALGRRVLVTSRAANSSPRHFLFDPVARAMEELPASRPWVPDAVLPDRKFVLYKARDGMEIPSFLTVPKGSAGKKLPLIVNIHGGPYVRGYNILDWNNSQYAMEPRFFAMRGYAVLEPEPRGSQGYGRKLFTSGFGKWGEEMQDDITDGVRHLIKEGIVDPNRVCLYGGSYGGYATLQGLIREPEMFKCGLSTVAVTDLELFQETTWSDIPVETKAMQDWFAERVGDPKKDQARIAKNSPLRNASKIKAPVLLMMGEADDRVPLVHGTKMRDAMKAAGVPHEFHVYVGEGHGWRKPENIVDFYKRAEAFFDKHLKN
jgi:dipeptidyl aminopeptidase/acylaminoacyl peptidase